MIPLTAGTIISSPSLIQNKKINSGKERIHKVNYIFYYRRKGRKQSKHRALRSYLHIHIYILLQYHGKKNLRNRKIEEQIHLKNIDTHYISI
mmetsp:Transcript_8473/g.16400  ORF Transcript_8473/g.16400 Transcript_8473/m.16400 type:complete len:92 (+) Transcript_8473:564-839(+)